MHGGTVPVGPSSPHYSNGSKCKKYIPPALATSYERAIQDPDLLSLRHDIALLDARREEILETLSSGHTWSKVVDLATLVGSGAMEELPALLQAIREGAAEQLVWREWTDLGEQRRRHTDTEIQRLKALNAYIDNQQAMVLISRLLSSVKRNVTDRAALAAISSDIRDLLHFTPPEDR